MTFCKVWNYLCFLWYKHVARITLHYTVVGCFSRKRLFTGYRKSVYVIIRLGHGIWTSLKLLWIKDRQNFSKRTRHKLYVKRQTKGSIKLVCCQLDPYPWRNFFIGMAAIHHPSNVSDIDFSSQWDDNKPTKLPTINRYNYTTSNYHYYIRGRFHLAHQFAGIEAIINSLSKLT